MGCDLPGGVVDLPEDLLEQIVIRLDTFDRARLSCACTAASRGYPSRTDVAWAIVLRDFEDISDVYSIFSVRLVYMGATFTVFRNGETIGAEARAGTLHKNTNMGLSGAEALFRETFQHLEDDGMAQILHTVYVWRFTLEDPPLPRRSYPRWFYPVHEFYIPFQHPVF